MTGYSRPLWFGIPCGSARPLCLSRALGALHLSPFGHEAARAECSAVDAVLELLDPIVAVEPLLVVQSASGNHVYEVAHESCQWQEKDGKQSCSNAINCTKSDEICQDRTSLRPGEAGGPKITVHRCGCHRRKKPKMSTPVTEEDEVHLD